MSWTRSHSILWCSVYAWFAKPDWDILYLLVAVLCSLIWTTSGLTFPRYAVITILRSDADVWLCMTWKSSDLMLTTDSSEFSQKKLFLFLLLISDLAVLYGLSNVKFSGHIFRSSLLGSATGLQTSSQTTFKIILLNLYYLLVWEILYQIIWHRLKIIQVVDFV